MTTFPTKGGDFTPAPEGVHLAICKYEGLVLVNSPMYAKSADGKVVKQRYIFQIDEKVPGKEMRFEVRATFGCSMGKKAKQREFVQSWLGKSMTDEQADKFDSKFMLGRACQINVVHNESNGTIYSNIKSVMPLPKGINNPPFVVEWYDSLDGENQKARWDREHTEALNWMAAQQNAPGVPDPDTEPAEGMPF